MSKVVLITGATDGIGFKTAEKMAEKRHTLLLHGRNKAKLREAKASIVERFPETEIKTFIADFSKLDKVVELAKSIEARFEKIDVLINNAGVFKTSNPRNADGVDTRFLVNTLAPFVLTKMLLPTLGKNGRVVNLSSAAQAPVDLDALQGFHALSDSEAYAQSKLAITMWSFHLAHIFGPDAPSLLAVNPSSFLGSKMVKDAYGADGKDLSIGANVLCRLALDSEFFNTTGRYFDNDIGQFTSPHPDALDSQKNNALVLAIEAMLTQLQISTKAIH